MKDGRPGFDEEYNSRRLKRFGTTTTTHDRLQQQQQQQQQFMRIFINNNQVSNCYLAWRPVVVVAYLAMIEKRQAQRISKMKKV
jgi:hypothetical protein